MKEVIGVGLPETSQPCCVKAIVTVYREFFSAPDPNRSSAAVAALVVPGMKLEIVAYAVLTVG